MVSTSLMRMKRSRKYGRGALVRAKMFAGIRGRDTSEICTGLNKSNYEMEQYVLGVASRKMR